MYVLIGQDTFVKKDPQGTVQVDPRRVTLGADSKVELLFSNTIPWSQKKVYTVGSTVHFVVKGVDKE